MSRKRARALAISRQAPGPKKKDFLFVIPELFKSCSSKKHGTLSPGHDPDVRAQPIGLEEFLKILAGPRITIQEL